MSKKRYVQHVSGRGEKWELYDNQADCDEMTWRVNPRRRSPGYFLPKSEYVLCEPSDEWEDVTECCVVHDFNNIEGIACGGVNVALNARYRLRKIDGPHNGQAFIVEKRKS